jgi:hypothetical protein
VNSNSWKFLLSSLHYFSETTTETNPLLNDTVGTSLYISNEEGNRKSLRKGVFILECKKMDKAQVPDNP